MPTFSPLKPPLLPSPIRPLSALPSSPIEITLKPLPIKELQERFYQHKPDVQVRHGPAVVDKKRQTGTISYSREVTLDLNNAILSVP